MFSTRKAIFLGSVTSAATSSRKAHNSLELSNFVNVLPIGKPILFIRSRVWVFWFSGAIYAHAQYIVLYI